MGCEETIAAVDVSLGLLLAVDVECRVEKGMTVVLVVVKVTTALLLEAGSLLLTGEDDKQTVDRGVAVSVD